MGHWVSQFYLRAWAPNGVLYRLDRKTGHIGKKGLRGVANQKSFYELKDLSGDEIEYLTKFIEIQPEPLRSMAMRFLKVYTFPPRIKSIGKGKLDAAFEARLDDAIANMGEALHKNIEDGLKPFIESMLRGDTSFFDRPKDAAIFLFAISVQFTRTKRARDSMTSVLGTQYKGCDPERMFDALSHVVSMAISSNLFVDHRSFRLVLLDNQTQTPFITADQPIINIHSGSNGEPPEKMEYFYPLSPRKAMLYMEAANAATRETIPSEFAVNHYNALMFSHSYEQVYSNSAEYLETVRKL